MSKKKQKIKTKQKTGFWEKQYKAVKKWFGKYHVPVFTFSISVFASIGVVSFSAIGGEDLFSHFWLGFMLIFILEFGFISLRYIAVSIGASKTMMSFINIFLVFLFILTVAPATIGINQKVAEDRQGPGPKPQKPDLIASLENNNNVLNDKITKNTNIMAYTTSSKIFNGLQEENKNLLSQIEANKTTITEKENNYQTELKAWNQKKTVSESKDPFVIFMRDFYLRFMIPGVQILNLFMSILGTSYLRRIKDKDEKKEKVPSKISILLDLLYTRIYSIISGKSIETIDLPGLQPAGVSSDFIQRLSDHEIKMDNVEKYTDKVLKDMEELAGELNIPAEKPKPTKPRNHLKDETIEKKTNEASKPIFFKTTMEKGVKKGKGKK